MASHLPLRLAAALVVAMTAAAAIDSAQAQWRDERYFFMRDPFRRPQPGPFFFPSHREFPQQRQVQPRESAPRAVEADSEPDQPAGTVYNSAETADAQRSSPAREYVLVIGDTLADQLAQGLADAFVGERPEVAVVKKTRASSGLVRTDYYDWPAQVTGFLPAEKATAIVLMIGSNDRQALRDDAGPHEPRSDRWRVIYAQRVENILTLLRTKNVPVFIVGTPSMRSKRLSDDMAYFNEIYREVAQKVGAHFVDIWDGFVDENNEFIMSGPALDGQRRRLRVGDGVHFSKPGARKLAHYVERDLVRLFDQLGPRAPQVPQQGPEAAAPPPPAGGGRPVAGPVLPLLQPAGPVGGLAGGGGSARPDDPTAARVLVEGRPVEAVSGRADDFRWPQPASVAKQPPAQPGQTVALPPAPGTAVNGGAPEPVAAEAAKAKSPALLRPASTQQK